MSADQTITSEIDWARVRREFPATEEVAYLNSAAAGPVPRRAAEAAAGYYREMMEAGDSAWDAWLERREEIRKRLAAFINAEPEEIAFTVNTSSGMNLIVDALEAEGDVVTCDLEFPVSSVPWLHRGIGVRFVETREGELHADDLARAAGDGAGTLCLSHVQYSNGLRLDLEELGRAKGRRAFVVNASQSAGAFRVDVKRMRIDALCATGHKWMLAGYGSGFVYLSRALLERTRARAAGWMSVHDPFRMANKEFRTRDDAAARAELGCPPFASIFALGASLDLMTEIGPPNIERRVLALNRHLTERLREISWAVLSPLRDERLRSAETLVAARRPKRVVAQLARRGVHVTEKPQGFRVATHFFNDETDVERLVAALAEMPPAAL